jgi:membrane associated rhomboid family serine protease
MIPLRDDNPTLRLAVLTIGLIVLNALVFLYQLTLSGGVDAVTFTEDFAFACEFGVVPEHIVNDPAGAANPCVHESLAHPGWVSLISHQFLHGEWLHLGGNMLFLWIFANNIEDRLGRIRFLPFYLLCGAIAAGGQILVDPSSEIPLIGASGAISGMLGAYLVLYPRKKILTLVYVFPLNIPAWAWLGIYFGMQFLLLGGSATAGGGGVAYMAHIAGFIAGAALILPFAVGRPDSVHRPNPFPREMRL